MDDYYFKTIEIKDDFTMLPNDYLEKKKITHFTDTQQAIMTVIERFSLGFQKKDRIDLSINDFADKTGRERKSVIRALNELKDRQIIILYGKTKKRVNIYGINFNYSLWDKKDSIKKDSVKNGTIKNVTKVSVKNDTKVSVKNDTTYKYINKNKYIYNNSPQKSHYDFEELEREIKEPEPIERTGVLFLQNRTQTEEPGQIRTEQNKKDG